MKVKDVILKTLSNSMSLEDFIKESNAIEGINKQSDKKEINAAKKFINLEAVEVQDMIDFVNVFEPKAKLRLKHGDNVSIGNYMPPMGGQMIYYNLLEILAEANLPQTNPLETHVKYEKLHPFTDCNGRSGRILWLWMIKRDLGRLPKLSFLHSFYYQSFDFMRINKDND